MLKDRRNVSFFEGYANVFNVLDLAGDIVLPGAFKSAVGEQFKLLWQHDQCNPIGFVEEVSEDQTGLFVQGYILNDVQKGKEAISLIENEITNSMSIGYQVLDSYHDGDVNYIKEVALNEISIVTFPANKWANVFIKMMCNRDGG